MLVKYALSNGKQEAWTTEHRFSDFEALHKKVCSILHFLFDRTPACALIPRCTCPRQLEELVSNLPSLPAKTLFGALDPNVVAKRKAELDNWLQAVLKIPAVLQRKEMHDFLQYPGRCSARFIDRKTSIRLIWYLYAENGVLIPPSSYPKVSDFFTDAVFGALEAVAKRMYCCSRTGSMIGVNDVVYHKAKIAGAAGDRSRGKLSNLSRPSLVTTQV